MRNYTRAKCCGNCKHLLTHGVGEYEDYEEFHYCNKSGLLPDNIAKEKYSWLSGYYIDETKIATDKMLKLFKGRDENLAHENLGVCDDFEQDEEVEL